MSQFPYPGLRPFEKSEADIFFGREEQVDVLIDKLAAHKFLGVIGPSGCGKSSLIRAGLLNALEAGFLASAGFQWRFAIFTPGSDPMKNLADALIAKDALESEIMQNEHSFGLLQASLDSFRGGLVDMFKQARLPKDTNLLIVVDQFEEIFRFHHHVSIDQAEAFVDLLLFASAADVPIYVVLTMRSDFLGDCALFPGLPEALNQSQFLTPRLTRKQRSEAILGPASVFEGTIDDGLINRLLNDTGTSPDQLPILQHALMRMWNTCTKKPLYLDLDDYTRIGTLKNALSNHADAAYNALTSDQQDIAEMLFRCLTERSLEKRDTRRPVRIQEVADIAEVHPEQVIAVIQVFSNPACSFIKLPAHQELKADDVMDITHESLIRQWQKLSQWSEKEAACADTYRRLLKTAQLWQKEKAELFRKLDLEIALKWQSEHHLNHHWAARYGGDYELAMTFLTKSQELHEQEQAAAKKAYQERAMILFDAWLTHASLHAKIEDFESARKVLDQTRALDPEIPATRIHARNMLAGYVHLMGGVADKVYEGAGACLFCVGISPDGKILVAGGESGVVALFDAEKGTLIRHLKGHTGQGSKVAVWAVVFHPQGKWFATAGLDTRIIIWQLPDGDKIREWKAQKSVYALALTDDANTLISGGTDDANTLISGGDDHDITFWDVETGALSKTLKGHEAIIFDLALSPDNKILASASYDYTARLWDMETGQMLHALSRHTDKVERVAFQPDGKILATGSSDKTIRLWDTSTGKTTAVLEGHKNAVFGLAFSNNGRSLVSGSLDRTLRVWDVESGIPMRLFQGHTAGITQLIETAGYIYSAANDGTVRRWRIPEYDQINGVKDGIQLIDCEDEPNATAISHQGDKIAVGYATGALQVFSLPDLRVLWENKTSHSDRIIRIDFSRDGTYLVTASFDKTATLWESDTGKAIQTLSGRSDAVHAVAFSPDGKTIATASFDGRIGVFQIGVEKGWFQSAHEGTVTSVVFNSKGSQVISAGVDGHIRIWEIETDHMQLVKDIKASNENMMWASISHDDKQIICGGRDYLVHLLNAKTGTKDAALVGHENTIFRVEFSKDDGLVATVSADAFVRIWDIATGNALFALRLPTHSGHPSPLWDFSFQGTPEGRQWLAVPLTRGKVVIYDLGVVFG
jgi:WD40 repeat protein/ABC-type dipeptide/oligopeptide/nickel transport system ATPase component